MPLTLKKEHRQMKKNLKQTANAKKRHNEDKHLGRGAQTADSKDRPAQEIADDEVEIAKTGGKPGTKSTPITGRKP
jgi:hypothetical protein